ncbi:uncharacterized protein [Asterias amurensis]|uniref:uncharacterized protein n=1 Tax=Asterias amurensis TaxID=7602 RepID=UPI003AB168B1
MESESDTENEKLQHDILQINEVLGQGEDEGDDSDWEFEKDDTTKAADDDHSIVFIDDGLVETNEHTCIDQHYSETTHPNQPSTSEECSLESLLLINQESQRNLQELLIRVNEELERNQNEQVQVAKNPSNREERNIDLSIMGLFRDYMELLQDSSGKKPPKNEDTKQRMSGDRPGPFVMKQKRWNDNQWEKLLEAVRTEGQKRAMQPILNRIEILETKKEQLSVPEVLEKVYEELAINKKQLVKTESIPMEELLGDRFREIDWDTTANVHLDAERSAKECQLQWQNLLHPSISRKKWTAKEKADLMLIASKYENRNWEAIAEELGTGRTALQCLRVFQLQDKNFVKPNFTDEEDTILVELAERLQVGKYIPFPKVAYFMEGHTQVQVIYRWIRRVDPAIKTGKFTKEEDDRLKKLINTYGAKNWARLAELMGGRTQFQIRHRWMTVLSPSIKLGHWDYEETMEFLQKVKEHGVGNWSKIAEVLQKNPDEKARTSYHLLQRFKNLVISYMTWRNNKCESDSHNEGGNEEDLLGSQLADKLLVFVPMKKREKEEAIARRLAREAAKAKNRKLAAKKRKRRRKVESSDEEEEESEEEEEEEEEDLDGLNDFDDLDDPDDCYGDQQYMTARQKFLAQRKELEQELEVDPYDARNEEDEDGIETNNVAGSSTGSIEQRNQINTVSNHLSGWQQRLNDRDAASKRAHVPDGLPSAKYDPEGMGLPMWMERLKHPSPKTKKGSGRKPCSELDVALVEAVNPMWICRGKGCGRQSSRQIGMQKRTGQEKLSPDDQKMMFKLLLKVLDVDIEYASTKVRFSLEVPSGANAISEETLPVIPTTQGTSVEADTAFQKSGTHITPGVTSDSTASTRCTQSTSGGWSVDTTRGCRTVTASTQPVTVGHQGVISGLQGLTYGPQSIASGLPVNGPQVLRAGTSAMATSCFPVHNFPFGMNTGHQVVRIGQQTMIMGQPSLIAAPLGTTSGSYRVVTGGSLSQNGGLPAGTSGHQMLVSYLPALATCPQAVASGPQVHANDLQTVAGNFQAVASDPPAVTNVPQTLASDPQSVNVVPPAGSNGPEMVTCVQQVVASGPQEVANVPPAVASGPGTMTSVPPPVASCPGTMTNITQAGSSGPRTITSVPQAVASGLQEEAIYHPAIASDTQAPTSLPQAVASDHQSVTSDPQEVTSDPLAVTSVPQRADSGLQEEVTSVQQAVASDPKSVTSVHPAVASGPGALTNVPKAVAGDPQEVASVPPAEASSPKAVTNVSQAVASGLQAETSNPQKVTSGTKSHKTSTKTSSRNVPQPEKASKDDKTNKSSPRRPKGRSLSVRQKLELQRGKLAKPVSSSSDNVTKNSSYWTPLLSSPRNQFGLPRHFTVGGTGSPTHIQSGFNQNLALAGRTNAGQNQSQHPSLLSGAASSTVHRQGSLIPVKNLAQVSNTALSTPDAASKKYVMFHDKQTGQMSLSPLRAPSGVVHKLPEGLIHSQSKVMSPSPVTQSQGSPSYQQSLLSGAAQQHNQLGPHPAAPPTGSHPAAAPTPITSGNTQLHVPPPTASPSHDPFSAASTLKALSQMMTSSVRGTGVNTPASQETRMNSGTLPQLLPSFEPRTPQIQRCTIPSTMSLSPALQNVGSLDPQQQHSTRPHKRNPHTSLANSHESQPKQQSNAAPVHSESASKQFDAQQSSSVVHNTSDLAKANLKSLSLPNGTKLVITSDQFKSLQKGNLGDVTGHILTPMPSSHEKKKKKKSKKDKRRRAKLKGKRATLKKLRKQSKEQSGETSTEADKVDPPPIRKRKLHTKDISLLPPNVATIQGLKSLLLDRKNLEERRDKFMSELEERLIKSAKADGKQTIHFSGYLEGRKTAQDKTRETVVPPTTLLHAESGSSNNQKESVTSESQVQLNDVAPTSSSTNDSEGPAKATSPQELVEEHLSSFKKTDSYQLLQRRFLSMFLWPGLLSSTRIKGTICIRGGDRESCFEMPRKPKPVKKNRETRGGHGPVAKEFADQSSHKNTDVTLESQRASVGLLQDQSVVEVGRSKTHSSKDQYSGDQAPSTSGHCGVQNPAMNSVGVVPENVGGTRNNDHVVQARGKKRKADNRPSSLFPHDDDEEQRMSEGDDYSGIPQNRKRKVNDANNTDAMKALFALQNFAV